MLGSVENDCPPGDWLWEDGGSGGGPSPFSGLTMGERRPGPRLERTEHHGFLVGRGMTQGLTVCSNLVS